MAPKSQKVAEEGIVSFFCKASGNPAPSFHWERKGKRINDRRNRYEIVDVPHMSVLRIKPVRAKRENNIIFTCVADNGLGEAKADATLFVYKKDESGNGKAVTRGPAWFFFSLGLWRVGRIRGQFVVAVVLFKLEVGVCLFVCLGFLGYLSLCNIKIFHFLLLLLLPVFFGELVDRLCDRVVIY